MTDAAMMSKKKVLQCSLPCQLESTPKLYIPSTINPEKELLRIAI
jgi:hypothetical protein